MSNHRNSRTRKSVVLAIIVALLLTGGLATTAWLISQRPSPEPVLELPAPNVTITEEAAPEPEPAPVVDSIFVREDFCDETGVPNLDDIGRFAYLYDFTTGDPVTSPQDFYDRAINEGENFGRVNLISGCDPLTSEPEISFTPINVSSDHCSLTHPEARELCRSVWPEYAPPYMTNLPPEWVFIDVEIPAWLQGKEMWEIGINYGLSGEDDTVSYTIPASAGVWEMSITYNGQTHTSELTVPRADFTTVKEAR